MASKKSAAQFKVAKNENLMTREEKFKTDITMISYKIKSQIIQSQRIDCMVQLREEYISFFHGDYPELDWLKDFQDSMTDVYRKIDEVIENMTLEKIMEEKDFLEDLYIKPKDIDDDFQMFHAFCTYMYARDWGSMLLALHRELLMLEE